MLKQFARTLAISVVAAATLLAGSAPRVSAADQDVDKTPPTAKYTAILAASSTKIGPAPAWGACGVTSPSTKLVYTFSSRTILYCGTQDTSGYWHIKYEHMSQFAALAAPVGLTWRDLLHGALYWNDYDPDKTSYSMSNQTYCRSRYLYLADSSGRVVVSQIFRTITSSSNGKVITAYPSSSQCS